MWTNLEQDHEHLLEVARGVTDDVSLQVSLIGIFVCCHQLVDLLIGPRSQDFNETLLIGADTRDGIFNFLGITIGKWPHETHNQSFKLSCQLILQVSNEVLAIEGLVALTDLLSLSVAPRSDELQDGLLVTAKALHGGVQGLGILAGVKVWEIVNGATVLSTLCLFGHGLRFYSREHTMREGLGTERETGHGH